MGLPRRMRLRRRADFLHVAQGAKGRANALLVVRSVPSPSPLSGTRFGFSVGKRLGGAVTRNLVKRRLREIVRQMEAREGFDVVIIARPAAAEASFQDLESVLRDALSRAGLLAEDREQTDERQLSRPREAVA